jgi:cholest-4-en-3-one 26-monooxygenase
VVEVSRQSELFNALPAERQLLAIFKLRGEEQRPEEPVLRQLLNMNGAEHDAYRSVVNRRFTPRAVAQLRAQIEAVTTELLDAAVDRTECDFVTDISAKLPLAVIAEMFGIPRADWPLMFRLSNEMIGPEDPEYAKSDSIRETLERARMEFFQYFSGLIADRQKNPRDDLSTALAHGCVHAQAIPPFELLSYFALLIIAGNETTRNATTGGLYALIQNPDQWQRLKRDPRLIPTAVDEIVRWVSPVIQFTRVAMRDTVLHGQKIREGEVLGLFYPSANRDEEVFEGPFKFDVARNPNPHLAFGIGAHYCLGANLARLELQIMFQQLAERLQSVELTGPIQRMRSNFVGGIKHMLIRYRMLPRN